MNGELGMREFCRSVVEFADEGRPFAVALALAVSGSTPRGVGTRAIVEGTGRIHGTVGGGAVEAETQRRAVEACASGEPVVFDFALDHATAQDEGPICGGAMRLLVDPTVSRDREHYAAALRALEERRRGVMLSWISAGSPRAVERRWIPENAFDTDAEYPGPVAFRLSLESDRATLFPGDELESSTLINVLVEPVVPNPRLLIVGGGHVGQAVAAQALPLGFDVTVLDDRAEFTDPALFPGGVSTRCGSVEEGIAAFDVAEDTYVVIVTRGHRHDGEALAACVRSPAVYIGMIGSKRKVALTRESLIEAGRATKGELDCVHAPIGLDIGAVTVPEIATSIVAELIAVRRSALEGPASKGTES